jgi:ABC-type nickel/cobalt efflux system permease component RcnA
MTSYTPIIAGLAVVNATVAQVAAVPDVSTLEGWLALASKVGATAVLGVACWVLWKQLRREQEDNIRLRDKYTTDLTGVIDRNTKVIERVEEVIRKCGGH